MQVVEAELRGVLVIQPDVFQDPRGYFLETYHERKYREAGLQATFVQDNRSRSSRGILRGLHMQRRRPQGKLVWVVEGEVFDVAVDVRRSSPTFGKWFGVTLSGETFRQLYVPPGFLHGFCVLSERVVFEYKCTDFYDPADELTVTWNDPTIGVAWPVQTPTLSAKDRAGKSLQEVLDQLPE